MVTVVTKTIGPSGRDYATFTLAEAAITAIANVEFGSTDLVTADGAIVFEVDAATYAESVTISGPWTTDAARNITFKAGAGSEHGGIPGTGVIIDPPTGTRPLLVGHEFTVVEGLNLLNDSTTAVWVDRNGVTLRNIVLTSTQRGFFLYAGIPSAPIVLENCVSRTSTATSHHAFWIFANAGSSNARLVNCTGSVEDSTNQVIKVQQLALTATAEIVNCLVLTDRAFTSTGTTTGSNNFGGSTDPFPIGLQGTPYPITATTDTLPGVGDFAIYEAETGQLYDNEDNAVWQAGAGTSTAGVPKLDILGVVRATGSCNPGAFEAAVVLTAAASVPLSNNAALHSNQLETQIPWIWLYELQTADDPPKRYRLTNFTQSVEFGLNASGQPLVYSPAPITHGDVQEGTDGSLPTIAVTVAHAGPLTGSVVDAANGFVGLPVRLMLVSALDIASGSAAVIQKGEVVSASMQKDAIVLQVSAFNLYQLQFPPFIHSRRRCRWIFGSVECGYNVSVAGAGFTTCNKTLANCEERGDDEVSLGFPRKHPSRFGAFPGIPRAGQ